MMDAFPNNHDLTVTSRSIFAHAISLYPSPYPMVSWLHACSCAVHTF